VPSFDRGYCLEGVAVDEFDDIPLLQSIHQEFSKATEAMVAFVREHLP
jgi:hypothetical protein